MKLQDKREPVIIGRINLTKQIRDLTIVANPAFFSVKLYMFSYTSVLTYVLGAQKNRLNGTILLSTNNLCFGLETRKLFFLVRSLKAVVNKAYKLS